MPTEPRTFHRYLAAFALPLLTTLAAPGLAQSAPRPAASLAATYRNDFLIGVATDFVPQSNLSADDIALIKSQFNVITPENSMKPDSVHPAEDRWTWTNADKLVAFCQENKIQLVGHCLVWHGQTGRWFFQGENGQPVTRETAIARMRQHILTEVGRDKGKIKGWDVVNEAISDHDTGGTTENLRPSGWLNAIGPDYLEYAFKFTHEADPSADLYYNDYNIEKGDKHKSSLLLLKRLLRDGVPITAVGIQGHWGLNNLPYDELDRAIEDYKALGLKVNISELDVTIVGQGGGQLTPVGGNPTTRPMRGRRPGRGPFAPPTPQQLQAQAAAYAKFFEIFLKHKDVIGRVTIWGLNDGRSWRQGQAPLLFDAQNRPKPAFDAVIAAHH
ncbi:MAG: endo-1,4-beta-xylanase [Tepidisphaeraceae bacterium]